jgi:hypothetical protein
MSIASNPEIPLSEIKARRFKPLRWYQRLWRWVTRQSH